MNTRTALLLLRLRYHLQGSDREGRPQELLAEDVALAAHTGTGASATWLGEAETEALLAVRPGGNIDAAVARDHLRAVLAQATSLHPALEKLARQRADALLESHRRVRRVTGGKARTRSAEVLPPIDLLGVFVFLPIGGAA